MSTIDPESCQLVEVPIDANGAIVVQDPSGLIAGGQVQVSRMVLGLLILAKFCLSSFLIS